MKKNIIALVSFFAIFWLAFSLFQNDAIYTSTLGKVADNWVNIDGERKLVNEPFQSLTNENYIQWDGVHYWIIQEHGYDIEVAGSDYIFAFFPLFPFLWDISGLPSVGVVFMNYLFFAVGLVLLYRAFSPSGNQKQHTLLVALMVPTMAVFVIPYTESTFLLTVAIGLYGLTKKKYWVYFLGFFLCALTRPSYTFLILAILGTEFFFFFRHKQVLDSLKSGLLKLLPLLLGTLVVSIIQFASEGGGFFKFVEVQKYWDHVFSIPHGLNDWSHEGFGMSMGIIFLLSIPSIILILQLLYTQIFRKNKTASNEIFEYNPINYVQVLSIIYLIGIFLFILLFQGGNLHGLSRYVLCSPFFFALMFYGFQYMKSIDLKIRVFALATLSLLAVLFLGLVEYSTYWNFSDLGLFLLIALVAFWLLQDFSSARVYRAGLYTCFLINIIWSAYLFNMYIANGWIYT